MLEISKEIVFIILGTNILLMGFIVIFVLNLNKKMKKFLTGNTENLEESLALNKTNIENLNKFEKEITEYLKSVEKRLGRSIQAIETVRFTPFQGIGSGGNQSFSTAFVNEAGDGIVVSGLYYSRDRVSIFTKPIKSFVSEFDLTDEEKQVLEDAKSKLK